MPKTNLIIGFLGSGKTTSILHLLANKDPAEKWAVLVNEFGEVGIDGALLADSGAMVKEIPGGCMCCVNGLPMQVGRNTLLRQGKPDRLLIEPTGLGHQKQILDLLTKVMKGKTVLMVTHRLRGLVSFDRIIVMDNGHIIEQGNHAELLAKQGRYYQFKQRL